eukprot:3477319-Prorocentrum_lima.AAC.1
MTSSLVGSEMCIRDRRCAARHFNAVSRDVLFRMFRRVLSRVRQALNQPVSYTHLTLPTICSV